MAVDKLKQQLAIREKDLAVVNEKISVLLAKVVHMSIAVSDHRKIEGVDKDIQNGLQNLRKLSADI